MVDLDKLISVSNSGKYPNLLNSVDIDAIKEIIEGNPDYFSDTTFNQAAAFIKSEGNETEYGFSSMIRTGINQFQYFDGHIGENALFKYLGGETYAYWKNGVLSNELLVFEGVPLIDATVDAICQLTSEVTGNPDTSMLKGLLDLLVPEEFGNYEVSVAKISRIDKTIKIGLLKTDSYLSEDVLKYVGTRSNTKLYQNIKGLTDCIDTITTDQTNNLIEMELESNADGFVKEIGFFLSTQFMKDAPNGTTPNDNFGTYSERRESHFTSVSSIIEVTKSLDWFPSEWLSELSTWEELPKGVVGGQLATANQDGLKRELIYGFN